MPTPPLLRRPIDGDVPVEPAGPQQRRVEHVGPVGRGDDDHRFGRREAVHLAEDLVERLFAFVVTAADARAAHPADGVDLVDEQDARGVFLRGPEHVADAAGPDADEHLDELGAVDREERHARLAGHRPGQQRLAGAGRAHQQHALGNLRPEPLELRRVLQELDDLLQLALGVLHPGDVVERRAADRWAVNRLAGLRMKLPNIPEPNGSEVRRIIHRRNSTIMMTGSIHSRN